MRKKLLSLFVLLMVMVTGAWAQITYTATDGTAGETNQSYDCFVDGKTNTKWCVTSVPSKFPLYIEFNTSSPITPKGYVLTTGGDNSKFNGRNPKSWKIYAKTSNEGGWTESDVIASVTDDTKMKDVDLTPYAFIMTNNTAYQYFRFEVSAIQSGTCFQLSEFKFLTADDATDLSCASITGLYSNYQVTGSAINLNYTVTDLTGTAIDASKYDATIKNSKNEVVTSLTEADNYKLIIKPKGGSGLTGSVEASFTVGPWHDNTIGGYCGNPNVNGGKNVWFEMSADNETITISGTGAMDNYYKNDFSVDKPWHAYKSNITTVVIGDGVTTIGDAAFYNYNALTSVSIPTSVTTIGKYAFYGCTGLQNITIPASVTTIDNYAFFQCSKLESVNFENNSKLTTIGYEAFIYCYKLASFTVPNSVTTIGDWAFYGCNDLTSFAIGSGVTSIGKGIIAYCTNLTTITVDVANEHFKAVDNILFSKDDKKIFAYPIGNANTEYTIPATVTTIGDYSFYYGKNLETITIPATVTSIGAFAFSGTKWFDNQTYDEYGVLYVNNMAVSWKDVSGEVIIKPGTTAIAGSAFYSCDDLTSIVIPASVTSIGYEAFGECDDLATVTIADGSQLTTIDDYAFYYCGSLQTIHVPESVTSIGKEAFCYCFQLESINIPNGVTSIDDCAFYECENLKTVTIADGSQLTSIGEYAFYDCEKLQSINIPNSVTSIGKGVFEDCSQLESINIPNGVTTIGDKTFYDCDALLNVTIPASVTIIGEGAFYDCDDLQTVTIADGSQLTTIGDYAFYYCYLKTFTIPAGVTSIGVDAFKNCSSITDVYCYANPANLTWDDGNCDDFKDNRGTVCHVENASAWSTIKEKVNLTFAGGYCGNPGVNGGKNLRYEVVGDALTISKNPNAVGTDFSMADNYDFGAGIKYIDIQDGVTSIGANAFKDFTALKTVTIPASVTSIGANAFNGCSDLAEVLVLPDTPPTLGDNAFTGINDDAEFIVRNAGYQSASGWTDVNGNSGVYSGCNFTMTVMDASCVDIAYIDADGKAAVCPVATPIAGDCHADVAFSFGGDVWYVVKEDVTIDGELGFSNTTGSTNIILCNDATLAVDIISASNKVNIFVQSNGDHTGAITAITDEEDVAAISVNKDLTINGGKITVSATGNKCYGIYSSDGNITINGGTIVVNAKKEGIFADERNLTINGGDITVTTNDGYGIDAEDGDLTINGGKITTTETNRSGLYANYTTINGGTLLVSGTKYGIYGCYFLTIHSGAITVNGAKYGLYADDYDMIVNGGTVNINDTQMGLYADGGNITLTNANVTVGVSVDANDCCGIYSDQDLVIINSNVNVTANSTSTDDSDSSYGIYSYGDLTISGGNITVNATADNDNSYGIRTRYDLNINGGKVVANGEVAGISVKDKGSFTLGWISPDDRITASSYITNGTISVEAGKSFYNGSEVLSGTIYDYNGGEPIGNLTKLNGKTLQPFKTISLADNADNSSAISEWNGGMANVTLSGRTLYKDGFWNTICLPFDMTAEQVTAQLAPTKLMTLSSSAFEDDELTLNFEGATTIEAGKPYIIKWTSGDDVTNPEFSGVTIKSAQANVETTYVDFIGNYGVISFTDEDKSVLLMGVKEVSTNNYVSTLYYPTSGAGLRAFRAYFQLNGLEVGSSSNAIKSFNLNFDVEGEPEPEVADAIMELKGERVEELKSEGWYDLSGRKLSEKPTVKGMYINNGKKVLIK